MDILIAYHKPGAPSEAMRLLERLKTLIERHCGCTIVAKQLDRIDTEDCKTTGIHVLLLPTRGGHWLELIEKGCTPLTPPPYLIAISLSHKLRQLGSKHPLITALHARRATALQEEDLDLIIETIRVQGLEPSIVLLEKTTDPIPEINNIDAIAPLAMLPGRHTENTTRYAEKHSIKSLGPILDYAYRDIASWIIGIAPRTKHNKP